jgi:hypothetical protein
MKVQVHREIRYQTIVLVVGAIIASCFLAACKEGNSGANAGGNQVEEARVTSPDGRFDAVMTREAIGGSLGGVYWNVFIVPKGAVAPKDGKKSLLYAAVLRGEKLLWKQNHLLEVHYDIAHIEEFRNLWGSNEAEDRSWRTGDYLTEVRLVPSSPDFSFLTPDGGFRPGE